MSWKIFELERLWERSYWEGVPAQDRMKVLGELWELARTTAFSPKIDIGMIRMAFFEPFGSSANRRVGLMLDEIELAQDELYQGRLERTRAELDMQWELSGMKGPR